MKIKKYNNRKTDKVLLEFEEFYSDAWLDPLVFDVEVINSMAEQFSGRRMAYNMWEFETYEKAEEFVFLYRLKHENNS